MYTDDQSLGFVADGDSAPRVFISYSHDTPEHKELVLRFATFLRAEAGVDVRMDIWFDNQRRDWSLWAIEQLADADFVVIIASPDYKRRADGTARPDEGRGAQFEAAIIRDNLTRDLRDQVRRVLPVVLPGRSIDEIPRFLAAYSTTRYVIDDFTLTGIADLLVAMTGVSEHAMPRRGRFVGSPFAGSTRGSPPSLPAPAVQSGARMDSVAVPLQHNHIQVISGEIPRRPRHFVVRAELQHARRLSDSSRVVVVVTGLRGVGKTHLAAAIARDTIKAGNALVGWINAGTTDTTHAGMAEIAAQLEVADPAGDAEKSAHHLRDYLSSKTEPGLLVFDNATDPDQIRRLLPVAGHTRVIITTTNHQFAALGELVDLGVYTRDESIEYLTKATGLTEPAEAADLTELLGDLPLALSVAAATITGRRLDYPHYRQLLTEQLLTHVLKRQTGHDYPLPLVQAILLSIQTVETATDAPDVDAKVRYLLQIIAMFSSAGVQRILLPEPGWALDEALERCVSASLLSWSTAGDAVIMHKLVARVLRERAQADDLVAAAVAVIQPLLFDRSEAWTNRELGTHIVAQIDALWQTGLPARARASIAERALAARDWAVEQLVESAYTTRSIALATATLTDYTQILGPDHPGTLQARHNLAYAHRAIGRLSKAIDLYRDVLTDRTKILGAEHPSTLATLNGLAYACQLMGNLTEAIPLFKTVLAGRDRVLGNDHPSTLTSRNGLAYAYASAGRLAEAIELYRAVLTDRERVLGLDHADTLTTRHNLAGAYRWAGRLTEAIHLYQQVLADRARVLGPDHPWTTRSRHNLAGAYRTAGHLDKALQLYRDVLTERLQVLGPDHPGTLTTRNKLARTYSAKGQLDRAVELYRDVADDYARILGPDHPGTLRARNGLARTLQANKRLHEAIDLHEQVIADRTRVLGPDHPDTLSSRHYLARTHGAAGHVDEAIRIYRGVLADRERLLGPDHPGTLATRRGLAHAYRAADRLDDAVHLYQTASIEHIPAPDTHQDKLLRLYQAIVNDSLRVLGPTHPDTLICRGRLANAYESTHQHPEAIRHYQAVLADCERALSPGHPLTTQIRASLAGLRRTPILLGPDDDEVHTTPAPK
ncbi:tetratricopeptide (TPR) repeat protein [Nocardia sp. GAS34]|uniref:FxSxx-COOH system tetratricopeptide repeat protein n=1 Tax=unclassified Nocardia TaxID=2637762 RepID=UPI003D1E4A82